jgi:hypothetical protein
MKSIIGRLHADRWKTFVPILGFTFAEFPVSLHPKSVGAVKQPVNRGEFYSAFFIVRKARDGLGRFAWLNLNEVRRCQENR